MFPVRTDHDTFKWKFSLADAIGRFVRWRLWSPEFYFDVIHRAGTKNQAADVLSPLETGGLDIAALEDELPEMKASLV